MAILLTEAAKLSNEVPRNPPPPHKAVAPATANKQTPLLSPFQLQKSRQKTKSN